MLAIVEKRCFCGVKGRLPGFEVGMMTRRWLGQRGRDRHTLFTDANRRLGARGPDDTSRYPTSVVATRRSGPFRVPWIHSIRYQSW